MFEEFVTSLEAVPAFLRPHFKPVDGGFKWSAPTSQHVPPTSSANAAVAEYRDRNIALMKAADEQTARMKELEEKLGGIDMQALEAGRIAMQNMQSEEDKKLLAAGRFDDVINRHTTEVRQNAQAEYDKLKKTNEELNSTYGTTRASLRDLKLQLGIRTAAEELGLQFAPSAADDVTYRGSQVMSLDDNDNLVSYDKDKMIRLNKDREQYSEKDFLQELVEKAPHLFIGANGPNIQNPGGPGSRLVGGTLNVKDGDIDGIGRNLEAVASGKMSVRMQ